MRKHLLFLFLKHQIGNCELTHERELALLTQNSIILKHRKKAQKHTERKREPYSHEKSKNFDT